MKTVKRNPKKRIKTNVIRPIEDPYDADWGGLFSPPGSQDGSGF